MEAKPWVLPPPASASSPVLSLLRDLGRGWFGGIIPDINKPTPFPR